MLYSFKKHYTKAKSNCYATSNPGNSKLLCSFWIANATFAAPTQNGNCNIAIAKELKGAVTVKELSKWFKFVV